MLPYILCAALLALATARALWVGMNWPHPRTDVLTGVTAAAAATFWYTINDVLPGPSLGTWPLDAADLLAIPAVLFASLLVGRTVLLSHTPSPTSAPASPAPASPSEEHP